MTTRGWITLVAMALLAVLPPVFYWTGNAFYLDLATRLTILAIAAVSLNLILGYGGLVSFGHAAYVGLGAYAVGIPAHHWLYGGLEDIGFATTNGLVHIPLAMA
ncbi:MAG: branched-chain amino acid ABC transporter permease, partial [Pseudomonadota bacterium]